MGQKSYAVVIAGVPSITGAGTDVAATTAAATHNTLFAATATTPSSAASATGGRTRNGGDERFWCGSAGQEEPMGLIYLVRSSGVLPPYNARTCEWTLYVVAVDLQPI